MIFIVNVTGQFDVRNRTFGRITKPYRVGQCWVDGSISLTPGGLPISKGLVVMNSIRFSGSPQDFSG